MRPSQDAEGDNTLNLLLFSTGGVAFAVDAARIAGTSAYTAGEEESPPWLHELLDFGTRPVVYREPVVLELAGDDDHPGRVIVDAMEDLISAHRDEIVPLPRAVTPHLLARGIWGVLPRGGRMIMVMDFRSHTGRNDA